MIHNENIFYEIHYNTKKMLYNILKERHIVTMNNFYENENWCT